MPDTFTEFLNLTKPQVGSSRDQWGDKLNADLDLVDVWAKGIDPLAKAALDTRGKKDGANNTVAQAVAGPVTFNGALSLLSTLTVTGLATLTGGTSIPRDQSIALGTGSVKETAASFDLSTGGSNVFRVLNGAGAERFKVTADSISFGANTLWHTGNLTPAQYAKKDVADTQVFQGALATTDLYLNRGGGKGRVYNDNATDNIVIKTGTDAAAKLFAFGIDGGLTVPGGVVAFGFSAPSFSTTGAAGALNLNSRDNTQSAMVYSNANNFRVFQNGQDTFRSALDGNIWTPLFGNLSDYVTNTANAKRDEANTNTANNYFNKTTSAVQNVANIPSFNGSALDINRPGVFRARWDVDTSGNTILRDGDSLDPKFYTTNQGRAWFKEIGFLNDRIEARAAAFADDRAQYRVRKTGDTMSGKLTISMANPVLELFYGGTIAQSLYVENDGSLCIRNSDNGFVYFRFKTSGELFSTQFGDLNTRIETRAAAYANDRVASVRLGARALTGSFNGFGSVEGTLGYVLVGFTSDNAGKAYQFYGRQIQYILGTGAVANAPTI